jgi:hypothetical protein
MSTRPDHLIVPESGVVPVTSHPPANKIIGLAIVFSQAKGDWVAFSQKDLAKGIMSDSAFDQGWQFLLQIGHLLKEVESGQTRYRLSEKCIAHTKQRLPA